DVDPEYQGKGYGTELMDHTLGFMLDHCKNLTVHVDPARSSKDDPLVFYTKYFNKKMIPFVQGLDHAAMVFNCQCSLNISINNILQGKYSFFRDSNLTAAQFLGVLNCNLSVEQVTQHPFERSQYLALMKGVDYR